MLYVAGGTSHNIVMFDTDGGYLGELTHPDLTGPQGLAFDDQGHLFSSSFFQNNIVQFAADGSYLRTITEGALSVPRSIAFVPVPEPSTVALLAFGALMLIRRRLRV